MKTQRRKSRKTLIDEEAPMICFHSYERLGRRGKLNLRNQARAKKLAFIDHEVA